MMPGRDPRIRLPDLGDNLIVPERPQLPEINLPPNVPVESPFGPVKAALDRIERKLDDIDNRLKVIEGKL
jgi:hypothetical protein